MKQIIERAVFEDRVSRKEEEVEGSKKVNEKLSSGRSLGQRVRKFKF